MRLASSLLKSCTMLQIRTILWLRWWLLLLGLLVACACWWLWLLVACCLRQLRLWLLVACNSWRWQWRTHLCCLLLLRSRGKWRIQSGRWRC